MQHILIASVLFRLREGKDVGFKQVEKHHARIVLENLRRTVAEVDVEIDDGDALQAVLGNGVHHAGGGVVDEAESAGAVAVGMVAGWADGAKACQAFLFITYRCFGQRLRLQNGRLGGSRGR